jgi:hypothetical protein
MSSIRKGEFRFFSYSNDHNPPHVDVRKDRGKFKVYLAVEGRTKPEMGPRKRMSKIDAMKAFRLVCEHHEEMVTLWEKAHGKSKIR